MCDGIKESSGNKEKISKWKLYKNQIKLLKESAKPDIPPTKVRMVSGSDGAVLLDRVSGIDITLSTSTDDTFDDVQPAKHKEEK